MLTCVYYVVVCGKKINKGSFLFVFFNPEAKMRFQKCVQFFF